jgi:hypothetical protein
MNIKVNVVRLETLSMNIPLIPCPDVHPPASRIPNTMINPPIVPRIGEMSATVSNLIDELKSAKV